MDAIYNDVTTATDDYKGLHTSPDGVFKALILGYFRHQHEVQNGADSACDERCQGHGGGPSPAGSDAGLGTVERAHAQARDGSTQQQAGQAVRSGDLHALHVCKHV